MLDWENIVISCNPLWIYSICSFYYYSLVYKQQIVDVAVGLLLDRYLEWSSQFSISAFTPDTKSSNLIGFLKTVGFFSSFKVGIPASMSSFWYQMPS